VLIASSVVFAVNPSDMALSHAILSRRDSEWTIAEITHRTASFEHWMRL
jgi:hypothetical protein